jgi:TonB-linked SusC/RagA family outer membrane protein
MYKFYSEILVQPRGYVYRSLLKIKLKTVLFFVFFLTISTFALAQKVTLSEKNKPLGEIFDKIRLQTQYDFLVTSSLLKTAKPVTINVKNAELTGVLKMIFRGQPLDYQIQNKVIIVSPKANLTPEQIIGPESMYAVSGMVTDKRGTPLTGATVILQRTKKGTTTGQSGIFTIKDVIITDTLIVSYIGFAPRKIGAATEAFLSVKLDETSNGLDEVVVQAYGQTTQRLTTGNIGHVGAAEIGKQTVMNPLSALEGRIAGVVVTQTSGYADGPVKIEIRGRGSINPAFTSDPLYIIDGVPLTVLDVGGTVHSFGTSSNNISRGLDQNGLSHSTGQSPLANINPADIESIDVLKDADATAIYGSRGANGVVLITTKRGKSGPLALGVDATQGVNFISRFYDVLNTAQYLDMRRGAFKNDGLQPTLSSAPDLLSWSPDAYTNWQKFAYGGLGSNTSVNTSLSGGSEQTTFRIGAGYNTSKQVNTVSGGFSRASVSYNLTTGTLNKRFTVSLTGQYTYSKSTQIGANAGTSLPPNAPPAFDSDGNLNYAGWGTAHGKYPFSDFLQPYNSGDNTLSSNLVLNAVILKGLNFNVNLGYNNLATDQTSFNPLASQDPYTGSLAFATSSFGNTKSHNVIIEPQINFTKLIGKGTLTALIGGTYQSNTTNSLLVRGTYKSDEYIKAISLAPIQVATGNYGQYKYAGIFGRIAYNYENKYLLDLNGRRDGSSKFGPGNQFGNFGSIGIGWIMTEEKWLKAALPEVISFMKLRGSYGLTGSDNVGDYQYLSQWGNGSDLNTGLAPYNGIAPLSPQIQPNNDYHWQVNKKLEGSFDISFFSDKVNLSVVYYRDRVDNQLISFPTPDLTGFSSVTANSPANVENKGWEFSVRSKFINKKDFSWDFNFNISFNTNTLRAYPDLAHSPFFNTYKIGGSLNDIYLLKYAGINPLTGQYTYVDHNHDGIIYQSASAFPGTQNDDRYAVLNIAPKFTGGFSNVFRYKDFSVTTAFAFAKQIGRSPYTAANGGYGNILTYVYKNTWTTVGQKDALFSRFTTTPVLSDFYFGGSTGEYVDASYIQLQTLALAYSMPSTVAKKLGVKSLSVHINSNNLFVITPYRGIDPQAQGYGGQPPARNILGGLSASF